MDSFSDTQALFAQLAAIPSEGAVQSIIENHDAWTHNAASLAAITPALRARLAASRDAVTRARIAAQTQRIRPLLTRLPSRAAAAG
jgi:hypothetical protein